MDRNITYYLPNAFTPGDGNYNPNFKLYGENIDVKTFEMMIFNRWGEQLCYTRDIEKGWDGRINGSDIAEQGLYTYYVSFVDLNFRFHELKGTVMLIQK